MESLDQTLQVNKFARRMRHLKTFSRGSLVKTQVLHFATTVFRPLRQIHFLQEIKRLLGRMLARAMALLPIAPQKRLLFQASLVSGVALMVTSFSVSATFTPAAMNFDTDYIAAYSLPGDVLVSNEDGYLVKINPQTHDSNRIGLTDYAVHAVENGETLSAIAVQYNLNVETIMWANNLFNANSIRSGHALLVPPVDGLSYNVQNGDNLEKIAKKYEISAESIIAQNALETEVIQKGQALFLPGAKPLYQPTVVANNYRGSVVSRDNRALVNAQPSSAAPAAGKTFIWPTKGKVTQGFRGGHYAIDIADRSKPPVWAAATGTITKVSSGTWGGGYGNHVIVDHGNGLETLYAHMSSVNVYEGQLVESGDVLGIMGNTGRVYGATGIHLHFEVISNGIKQNPWNYL